MKYIRVYTAWALYWAGDAVSRLPLCGPIYRIYNRLMVLSDKVQGDGGGPWN